MKKKLYLIWLNSGKHCLSNKVIAFKILHYIYPAKKTLERFKLDINYPCTFCEVQIETISHLFQQCMCYGGVDWSLTLHSKENWTNNSEAKGNLAPCKPSYHYQFWSLSYLASRIYDTRWWWTSVFYLVYNTQGQLLSYRNSNKI